MSNRVLHSALAVAAATGLTLAAAGSVAAQASSPPGWRIVKNLEQTYGFISLGGIAASGPGNAWAMGTTSQSLVVTRWNGSTWQDVKPPAKFTGLTGPSNVQTGPLGTSSAANAWLFPVVIGATSAWYALHWNGKGWTTARLAGAAGILNTAVFSPSDVWAFGFAPPKTPVLGYGPPYVRHYNGHTWRRVSMPGVAAQGLSAVSPRDIWAVGPTTRTAGAFHPVFIAMHWNGKSWRALGLPKVSAPKGHFAVPRGLVALSPSNVWLAEGYSVASPSGVGEPPGVILLHWNGKRWSQVSRDLKIYTSGMSPDGHGGLWLGAYTAAGRGYFAHYAAGRWALQVAPAPAGYTDVATPQVLIPGTRSVWATGYLTPTGTGAAQPVILKYGP